MTSEKRLRKKQAPAVYNGKPAMSTPLEITPSSAAYVRPKPCRMGGSAVSCDKIRTASDDISGLWLAGASEGLNRRKNNKKNRKYPQKYVVTRVVLCLRTSINLSLFVNNLVVPIALEGRRVVCAEIALVSCPMERICNNCQYFVEAITSILGEHIWGDCVKPNGKEEHGVFTWGDSSCEDFRPRQNSTSSQERESLE